MRIRIPLFFIFIITFWACNNDISTTGKDFVDTDAFVECKTYDVYDTYTIKIDSFPTSSGSPYSYLSSLATGICRDEITGTVSATPYVPLAPSLPFPVFDRAATYDSLTFSFSYNGNIWGDTTVMVVNDTAQTQKISIWQTSALPSMENPQGSSIYRTLYNLEKLPLSRELGKTEFFPYKRELKYHWFRLDDTFGEELMEKMKFLALEYKNDEDIAIKKFIHEYFDFAIVSDPNNTCLFELNNAIDSIRMTLHYHVGEKDYTMRFNRTDSYNQYSFVNITSDLSSSPYGVLKTQLDELDFIDAKQEGARIGQAVTEGMNGLMIKLKLPIHAANDRYSTIIKAELVFTPQENTQKGLQVMDSLFLYQINKLNSITQGLSACQKTQNPLNPELEEYIIDITDYYIDLCSRSDGDENSYVVASINANTIPYTFNRLVIDEYPELRVYYTNYDMHE